MPLKLIDISTTHMVIKQIPFNQLWREHVGWEKFKEQMEIERRYGKNPNSTVPCKEFDSLISGNWRLS
jgi:hypothetical protein